MEEAINNTLKSGKYEYMAFNESLWIKIFYHNFRNRATFADEKEAKNVNTNDKYSIFSEISNEHRINGKFEFILYYPSLSGKYNHWRQTRNPSKEFDYDGKSNATGYEPVHIDWTSKAWGGLVRSIPSNNLTSSFIDGSIGSSTYYYCIGKYPKTAHWDNKAIPGPSDEVQEVYLWMKIHQITDRFKISCRGYNSMTFSRYFLFVNLIYS